jgi:isopentenyl-diphosphate delta-isomerase
MSKPTPPIFRRKSEHLRIVLEEEVRHRGSTLLEGIRLVHQALPELDLERVDTGVEFFGKRLRAPLMITSMTGGAGQAGEMNRQLARAAAGAGIAFSVGSQRVLFDHPQALPDFDVRRLIPDGVLLGNIGAVQLPERSLDEVAELAARIEADGICVHLNPAQELCQPEGNRSFEGLLERIARLVERMEGRVLVKETGAGLSPGALQALASAGVRYIDVAGSGGTSWTRVEMFRCPDGPERQVGETFGDWGVPTAFSVIAARRLCPERTRVVGSGGVESGLDCARVIAAGAHVAGFARSALLAWREGGEAGITAYLERLVHELRCAMLLTGSADVEALRRTARVYTGELRRWLAAFDWLDHDA